MFDKFIFQKIDCSHLNAFKNNHPRKKVLLNTPQLINFKNI